MSGLTLTLAAAALAVSPMASSPLPMQKPAMRAAPVAISRAVFVARLDKGYRTLDADRNGAVTAAELASAEVTARKGAEAAAATRRHDAFARLDTNRDGQLSQAEFDAAAAALPHPAPADPAAMLAALDSDNDKKVSLTEYRARGLLRFDRADSNGDGIVTPDEDHASMRR